MDKLGLFLITAVIAFSSCQNSALKSELDETRRLIQSVDSVETAMSALDLTVVDSAGHTVANQMAYIQNHWGDTLTRETAAMLTIYRRSGKTLKKDLGRASQINEEIDYSRKQLQNLLSDGENGFFNKEEYNEKLNAERRAVSNLVSESGSFLFAVEARMLDYNRLYPVVDSLIDDLYLRGYR